MAWAAAVEGSLTDDESLDALVKEFADDTSHDGSWLLLGALLADTAAHRRRVDLAEFLLERLRPVAHLVAVDANGHYCHGCIARPLSRLARLLGNDTEALSLHDVAAQVDRGAALDRFVLMQEVEDHIDGHGSPSALLGLAGRCRARGLSRLAERAEHRRGAVLDAALSPRRQAVLRGLADGHTYEAIAETLGYSHGTVRKEAIAVYRVLGADGRDDAVQRAVERGWIEPPTH